MGKLSAFRIFVMTFNVEAVRFCETSGLTRNMFNIGKLSCNDPFFIEFLIDRIKNAQANYDIVCFAFQESPSPGDKLVSDMMPGKMSPEFREISLVEAMGVGVASVKKFTLRGLRLSIYQNNESAFNISNTSLDTIFCDGKDEYTHGKGGVTVILDVDKIGKIAIIDVHLPFNSATLKGIGSREKALVKQNSCLVKTYNNFAVKNDVDYVFYVGDLNYRCDIKNAKKAYETLKKEGFTAYLKFDELGEEMRKGSIPVLLEGIDNKGPLFAPTCKMRKGRGDKNCYDNIPDEGCYKLGIFNQRAPSWCDRILYRTFEGKDKKIKCFIYDRWDSKNGISLSDHAAVIGGFSIE